MKRISLVVMALAVSFAASAQNVQDAAADAAKAILEAPAEQQKVEKPKYWTESLKTQLNFSQTSLTNWAAGGDNTVSLQGYIDANANWKKKEMFWNNRLQLDYGFLYASSKPILQKSTDRIYLESKWGYKTDKMKKFYFSANYDFKSQFSSGWDYKTPGSIDGLEGAPLRQAWRDARVLKSNLLSPAYTNLALGIDWAPAKWLSVNIAPLTGGFVIVKDAELRKSYSMKVKESTTDQMLADANDAVAKSAAASKAEKDAAAIALGNLYRAAKFEFGAQVKADAKVNVNDNFSYSTQLVVFVNYLDIKHCPRINWDNRISWKLAKYFNLTFATNLIYDDKIMIKNDKDIDMYPDGKARVQFKETLSIGFTYIIASKK
jgi:hypothetical protein